VDTTTLQPKLPVAETFEADYLEHWKILPLEIAGDRLRVAVAGEPAAEVLEDLELSFGVSLELVPVPADPPRWRRSPTRATWRTSRPSSGS